MHFIIFCLPPLISYFCGSVGDSEALFAGGEAHPSGGHVSRELFVSKSGAAQQARNRGEGVAGNAPEPGGHIEKRKGARPRRAVHQLDPRLNRHQAGRRDREAALPQVYGLHDEEGGELCHPQEENDRGK
jgi:hypothetical protein